MTDLSSLGALSKKAVGTPKNPYPKRRILDLFKRVKQSALNGDAKAQYQLAKFFPENSSSYYKWMRKAAQKGFTNAMLALSENLAKKNTGESLREAASYVLNILHSEDSHMIYEANKLLEENAPLAAMVQQKTARTINRNSIFAELLSSITSKNEDPSPQRTM